MVQTNYFSTPAECPYCHLGATMVFESDIGVLGYEVFDVGDLVIKSVPLFPAHAKHHKPVGPSLNVDWDHPFWAVGLARCPSCNRDVVARVEIRDRRFSAARPTLEELDLFAWGPVDESQNG
jgi:hypothetical protein